MCGRYVTAIERALEREWELIRAPDPFRSFNVAPSTQVPVVYQSSAGRECVAMRWGLIPFWAKGAPTKYSTINATSERMREAPAYRGAWKRGQRCLFPALGFYEWQALGEGKTKQPWYIRVPKHELFAMAGLWDRSEKENGDSVLSATIVTVPANELLAEIHNSKKRMPLILDPEDFPAWLGDDSQAADTVVAPYPASRMEAWPVSTKVNSPRNQGPELVEPLQP